MHKNDLVPFDRSGRSSRSVRVRRAVAVVALAAFLPLATVGCFGRFQLVRNVYKFNQEVSPDKWMQWFVFLILTIVPVYGLASWIDALVLNSLEFWTGENPAMAGVPGETRVVRGEDGSVATLTLQADRSIQVSILHPDGAEQQLLLTREEGAVTARASDGTLLARVADVAGRPALVGGTLAASH